MRSGPKKAGAQRAAAALILATLLGVSGCSHLHAMHWPWHHPAPPPAAPVHELDISSSALDRAAVRQYWNRNTLVVDLSAASGSGAITLKPAAGSAWPVRLAVRVTPGSIGLLEVRGEQRLSLPITPAGGKPVELELVPRLYHSKTAQLSISWGPASAPAP
jgi:hypothetical protein